MLIKQLSLFVENKPGALNAICQVLSKNHLDIRTLALADTRQFGILRILIEDWKKALKVLEDAGFVAKVTDVLAVPVPNRPGGLAGILDVLDKNQLQVDYMYAFTAGKEASAIMVFSFETPARALAILHEANVNVLEPVDLFK